MPEEVKRDSRDTWLLFASRVVRMFAYGLLAVILGIYLARRGFTSYRIGLLLTLTLVGDTAISLALTTVADRIGRRRTLLAGAVLMMAAGGLFAATNNFWLLLLAATIGVISPGGNEVGPFLAVEQAALSQTLPRDRRTAFFAWYYLAGSIATAAGSLASGVLARTFQIHGLSVTESYRRLFVAYAGLGFLLALIALALSGAAEVGPARCDSPTLRSRFGLHQSRGIVLKLASLFVLDAFAGGLLVQSLVAYWFHLRFGLDAAWIGAIFFGANLLAGVSALAAARLARRFGLVNTMVFTHLPSNLLLILVPFMPTLALVVLLFLLRFSISQMDVPTRQAYLMAVVSPDERSAAGGIANVARTVGASLSPAVAGLFLSGAALFGAVFVLSGSLKVIYDLLLWRNFRKVEARD